MARRGQYPPRVERFLPLFRLMRHHIDQGATPNRAAELVANEHWRKTPSPTWEACVAWLCCTYRFDYFTGVIFAAKSATT